METILNSKYAARGGCTIKRSVEDASLLHLEYVLLNLEITRVMLEIPVTKRSRKSFNIMRQCYVQIKDYKNGTFAF